MAEMKTGGVLVVRRDNETREPLEIAVVPPAWSNPNPWSDPSRSDSHYDMQEVARDPLNRIVPSAPVVMAKAWGPGMSVVAVGG